MNRAGTTTTPDGQHHMELALNRSEQSMMSEEVSPRRLEEVGAGVGLFMQVVGLLHDTGQRVLNQTGVETIDAHVIRRPATANSSSTEMPQAYPHIDSVAASNEASSLARPSGDVFNDMASHETGANAAQGTMQHIETGISSAPDYRSQPVNQNAGVRPPNNPAEAAAAYAELNQIHGSLQPPVLEQQPGVPLDQLGTAERMYFENLESEFPEDGGARV